MVKLHVGCGKRYLPGWTHVDVLPFDHIDHQATIDNLFMFEEGSVDEIYACHVLEHVGRREVLKVLAEFSRVLRVGGVLRLAVPDFESLVEHYVANKQSLSHLMGFLVGGQTDQYDHHCMEFDLFFLTELLRCSGFDSVERYDWKAFFPPGFDDFSASYLPHMDFENGRLMSLNVTATKRTAPLSEALPAEIILATASNRARA
jgi:predicted SAM-dependent methyltransferase